MSGTIKGLVLSANLENAPTLVDIPKDGQLQWLQGTVGGYIEVSEQGGTLPGSEEPGGVCFVFHEEAKVHGDATLNARATTLWMAACGWAGTEPMPGDYLAGTVVLVGPADDEGEQTDLPTAWSMAALEVDRRVNA